MSYREVCKCGHDKATHFRDLNTGARASCLASMCDCKRYRDPGTPDTVPPPKARTPKTISTLPPPNPWGYWP